MTLSNVLHEVSLTYMLVMLLPFLKFCKHPGQHKTKRMHVKLYCQTPTPGETWELTLLSRGNKNNKNNKNNPHLNSPRRDCARVLKFCMRPSETKKIRLHPKKNLLKFVLKKTHPTVSFGCNLILLVTDGRMQNFKTLAQSLLGEFR